MKEKIDLFQHVTPERRTGKSPGDCSYMLLAFLIFGGGTLLLGIVTFLGFR